MATDAPNQKPIDEPSRDAATEDRATPPEWAEYRLPAWMIRTPEPERPRVNGYF